MMQAGRAVENQRMRDWLAANEDFRRYVLDRLRAGGAADGPQAGRTRRRVFAEEGSAGPMADAPGDGGDRIAGAGSVRYAGPVASGVS
jgi:hypothetical protein